MGQYIYIYAIYIYPQIPGTTLASRSAGGGAARRQGMDRPLEDTAATSSARVYLQVAMEKVALADRVVRMKEVKP